MNLFILNPKQEWLVAFLNKIQTHERLKRILFIMMKHTMGINALKSAM